MGSWCPTGCNRLPLYPHDPSWFLVPGTPTTRMLLSYQTKSGRRNRDSRYHHICCVRSSCFMTYLCGIILLIHPCHAAQCCNNHGPCCPCDGPSSTASISCECSNNGLAGGWVTIHCLLQCDIMSSAWEVLLTRLFLGEASHDSAAWKESVLKWCWKLWKVLLVIKYWIIGHGV